MRIKYLSLVIVSLGLIGCGQKSNPNFTIMCEDDVQELHISFDFGNMGVTELKIPKPIYLDLLRKTAPERTKNNGETTLKFPITGYTDSYIKYGRTSFWDDERNLIIDNTFNRASMNLAQSNGWYKEDGSLADSAYPGDLGNPMTLNYSCEKPIA